MHSSNLWRSGRHRHVWRQSFRQRRAETLRLVAAGARAFAELDAAAVAALERDGLVRLTDDLVALPV